MNITGGKYNSRKIKVPEYDNIKPTLSKTRQGIFNALSSLIEFENKTFVDLFSGSGIMSLEALSRGFKVYSFEKDRKTAFAIKSAFQSLGENANLFIGDALKKLPETKIKADVVFIDPPYMSGLYEKSLDVISAKNILNPCGIIIMEHPVNISVMPHEFFETIKVKTYSDKQITFVKLIERND